MAGLKKLVVGLEKLKVFQTDAGVFGSGFLEWGIVHGHGARTLHQSFDLDLITRTRTASKFDLSAMSDECKQQQEDSDSVSG